MINKTQYIIFLFLSIPISANSQNSIDSLLAEIEKNNKSIKANTQLWEARKSYYKTGLNPPNPKVEYEFMKGTPATAGNQTDFFVLQEFDFPTSYINKKQLANEQIQKIETEQQAFKQSLLLGAKLYCIELIYLNKKRNELAKRLLNAEKLYSHFKIKFENGDANSLELNKVRLQLINLQNEIRSTESKINQYYQKLIELNGGIEVNFNEIIYPLEPNLPDFNTLEKTIEENDPILKSYQQEKVIAEKKVAVNRALTYPKLEGGYHSQQILGQSFHGVHVGITIPLWEGKNSVKHQKEQLFFSELLIENHSTEHFYEIKQLYEEYENLKITISEYQPILNNLSNNELLEKSLELGEISSIQYFMELHYYYDSFDEYLNIERKYHIVITKLLKYQL